MKLLFEDEREEPVLFFYRQPNPADKEREGGSPNLKAIDNKKEYPLAY
jgi:hypothetical protein